MWWRTGRGGIGRVVLVGTLVLGALLSGWAGGTGVVRAATCTVTSTADAGNNTLRAAIGQTDNFTSGCDTITITATGTITLASDLPTVARTVSVTGPGAATLTIDRNFSPSCPDPCAAFRFGTGGNLSISGLTISRGRYGLYSAKDGSATVTNTTFSANNYGMRYSNGTGTVTVTNSTFSAINAGIFHRNQNDDGTVTGTGTLTVANSTFTGGIGIQVIKGVSASVTGSAFKNTVNGVAVSFDATATVSDSTIEGGDAWGLSVNGGQLTVTNSRISTSTNFTMGM